MLSGSYDQVAMYDTYNLFTAPIKFNDQPAALIESMIHIKDCEITNEGTHRDSINEWAYRFTLLQNLAASNTIPTAVLEQIVLQFLGHLPCTPPTFGQSKGDSNVG